MRRPWLPPLLLACFLVGAPAGPASPRADPPRPRFVVVVVIDQLRADLLERLAPQLTGGLARVLADGAVFTNAFHDHGLTETPPGHATISTGVYPARHGIVNNPKEGGEKAEAQRCERLMNTPFGDVLTLEPADALVEHAGLGLDGAPDLLFVSFSAFDSVGHAFGPRSPEVADALFRIDESLDECFRRLDRSVGPRIRRGLHVQRVSAVDIAPTLAEILRVATPGDLDGRSLVPLFGPRVQDALAPSPLP